MSFNNNNNNLFTINLQGPNRLLNIFYDLLWESLNKATNKFNCEDLTQTKPNLEIIEFCDILKSFSLFSLVNSPARICRLGDRVTQSSVDYLLTNFDSYTSCVNYDPGISDHHTQLLEFTTSIVTIPNIDF